MRIIDAFMSVPMILLALIIGSLLGGGLKNVILALGIGMIAVHARIMCGQAMTIMQNDYIMAAKSWVRAACGSWSDTYCPIPSPRFW